MKTMSAEYEGKVSDYQSKEALMTEPVRLDKQKELVDLEDRINSFQEKNEVEVAGNINGGAYILNKKHFIENTPSGNFSIEQNYFQALHTTEKFYGFPFHNYFIDIGIPESYKQANDDFKEFETFDSSIGIGR